MNVIYYTEVNAMCIIGLLLLCSQLQQKHDHGSTDKNVFRIMLIATIVLCLADLFSGILRGQTFYGARILTEVSNLLYFVMMTAIGYLWLLYVNIKLNNASRKKMALWAIPLALVVLVALSNPWTNILFTLGPNNLYERGNGVYFHWLVSWLYMLISTLQIIRTVLREKNRSKRHDLHALLYFIIAPAAASLIQMLFYGVTCTQVGIAISLLIVFLSEQNVQILSDALTGLNNRRGFSHYADELLSRHDGTVLSIWMIDINNFKQINDKLSHVIGDRALKDAADALRAVCAEASSRLFLCRYGGDEFVIAGCNCSAGYETLLRERIHEEFERRNNMKKRPYTLTASIGTAVGKCSTAAGIEHLLHAADEAMYSEKKRSKQIQK